jgi:hypothetical protein
MDGFVLTNNETFQSSINTIMNNTNNASARNSFEQAKIMFAKAMLDKFSGQDAWQKALRWAAGLKLSQSEIRCEVKLTTATTNFNFGVTTIQSNTDNVIYNTEKRLNQQDSLVVNEYGIFIRKPASATDTTDALFTYANPNTFSTANVATALNGTLYSHGQFQVTVNNDVVVPARGLFNHKYIPQTQGAVGITGQTIFPLDQQRGAEDGFITMEPNLVLIGSKNYMPQIILPAALAAAETNQRVVLIFRGILAQNSTIIN